MPAFDESLGMRGMASPTSERIEPSAQGAIFCDRHLKVHANKLFLYAFVSNNRVFDGRRS